MHASEFGQMMHFHLWRWRESIKSLSLFGGEAVWKICTYNTFTFNFCQATSKFTVRKNYSDEKFTFCQSRSKLTARKSCFDETFTLYEKFILMTLSLSVKDGAKIAVWKRYFDDTFTFCQRWSKDSCMKKVFWWHFHFLSMMDQR